MGDQVDGKVVVAKAAVVACVDPRIQERLAQFRKEHGLNGASSTPHHVPGPSLHIAFEFLGLDVAVKELGATVIHLLDHAAPECLGFITRFGAGYNPTLHEEELRKARARLNQRYPSVTIITYVMMSDGIIEVN